MEVPSFPTHLNFSREKICWNWPFLHSRYSSTFLFFIKKNNKNIIMPGWAIRFFCAQCVTIPAFSSSKFFKYFFLWSSWEEEYGSHFTNNSCPRNMKDLCSFIQYLNSERLAACGDVGVVTATAEDVAGMDKAQVLALPKPRPAAQLSLFRAVF